MVGVAVNIVAGVPSTPFLVYSSRLFVDMLQLYLASVVRAKLVCIYVWRNGLLLS
jgi:hypothetical protein